MFLTQYKETLSVYLAKLFLLTTVWSKLISLDYSKYNLLYGVSERFTFFMYSNPSKLANFGGRIIRDREFGNRELGCYFTSKKSIWGGFQLLNNKNREFEDFASLEPRVCEDVVYRTQNTYLDCK